MGECLGLEAVIYPPSCKYQIVDGSHVTYVVGKTTLKVTFEGETVALENVAVFSDMV